MLDLVKDKPTDWAKMPYAARNIIQGVVGALNEVKCLSVEDRGRIEETNKRTWGVVLPWLAKRTGTTPEIVRDALMANRKYWTLSGLRTAFEHRNCFNSGGYAEGTECDGDLRRCRHSRAYYDVTWARDDVTGDISDIEVKARICPLCKEYQAETTNTKQSNADRVF